MAGQYCLGRGFASTAGLNLQHSLVQRLLDGRLLDPSVDYTAPNLMIADIPCGTCLWLLDLARKVHPTTKLDGFDINLLQGPPAPWLPLAISVSKLDLFQDVPDHLVGRYDIVHVSLVVCFVDDNHIGDIVHRLVKLLKPGGHIEWLEFAISDTEFLGPDPAYAPKALPKAVEQLWDIVGWTCPEWPRKLGEVLSTAEELELLSTIRPAKNMSLGRAFADGELLAMGPTVTTAMERKPERAHEIHEFRKKAQEAMSEVVNKGIGCFPPLVLAVAKKSTRVSVRTDIL